MVVPDWLTTFVGLEGLAEREFVFEPIFIPGLLQTEEYAAAVTAGTPRQTQLRHLVTMAALPTITIQVIRA